MVFAAPDVESRAQFQYPGGDRSSMHHHIALNLFAVMQRWSADGFKLLQSLDFWSFSVTSTEVSGWHEPIFTQLPELMGGMGSISYRMDSRSLAITMMIVMNLPSALSYGRFNANLAPRVSLFREVSDFSHAVVVI